MRIAAGERCADRVGQPFRVITALAITNNTAAHANMDPAVPKPAI
jgi:hypothetical protein